MYGDIIVSEIIATFCKASFLMATKAKREKLNRYVDYVESELSYNVGKDHHVTFNKAACLHCEVSMLKLAPIFPTKKQNEKPSETFRKPQK